MYKENLASLFKEISDKPYLPAKPIVHSQFPLKEINNIGSLIKRNTCMNVVKHEIEAPMIIKKQAPRLTN